MSVTEILRRAIATMDGDAIVLRKADLVEIERELSLGEAARDTLVNMRTMINALTGATA